jgi:predicted DNA-binding ribbon-helix-helix protein
MPKSSIPKRTIRLNGRKTGVTVEDQFWNALKEIAIKRDIYLSDLVAEINEQRGHGNLSSAVRLFVLDYYQGLRKKKLSEGAVGAHRADRPSARERDRDGTPSSRIVRESAPTQ